MLPEYKKKVWDFQIKCLPGNFVWSHLRIKSIVVV